MSSRTRLDDEDHAIRLLSMLRDRGDAPPGSLLIVLADADATAVGAACVAGVPPDPPQHERVGALGPFLRELHGSGAAHGALLAVVRHGSTQIGGGDLAWHDAFAGASRTAGLTSHGVYVLTPGRVVRVSVRGRRVA